MYSIDLSNNTVEYDVVYSNRRKTIGLIMDKQGLVIRAPPDADLDEITSVIQKREDWILTQIKEFEKIEDAPKPKQFISGERLLYIGRSYQFILQRQDTKKVSFGFKKGKFVAIIPNDGQDYSDTIRKKAVLWFKAKALVKLKERASIYTPKVGKRPTEIRVRKLKARWGTCQPDDSIDFNWKIILAPMHIIDYVVVHELCHLVIKDHSRKFLSKVSAILVDHEKRREWLKINGATLDF